MVNSVPRANASAALKIGQVIMKKPTILQAAADKFKQRLTLDKSHLVKDETMRDDTSRNTRKGATQPRLSREKQKPEPCSRTSGGRKVVSDTIHAIGLKKYKKNERLCA